MLGERGGDTSDGATVLPVAHAVTFRADAAAVSATDVNRVGKGVQG
jgi:hypothetical protein